MTPNEIRDRAAAMGARSAGLRRDMQALWQEVHTAVLADCNARWPPLHPRMITQRYDTARLAMLTAICEGRRGEAKADALRAVGLPC